MHESSSFEQLVSEALDDLPEEFSSKLNNVSIVIEDYPTPYQQQKMRLRHPYQLFGLYEGIPQTKRTSGYSFLPDKITIFQRPIEVFSPDEAAVKEQIRKTLLHEIGHHFGLTDQELKKIHY